LSSSIPFGVALILLRGLFIRPRYLPGVVLSDDGAVDDIDVDVGDVDDNDVDDSDVDDIDVDDDADNDNDVFWMEASAFCEADWYLILKLSNQLCLVMLSRLYPIPIPASESDKNSGVTFKNECRTQLLMTCLLFLIWSKQSLHTSPSSQDLHTKRPVRRVSVLPHPSQILQYVQLFSFEKI
jgi:hypothetical protein